MSDKLKDTHFSRRRFLQAALLGVAVSQLGPWFPSASASSSLDADLVEGVDVFEGPLGSIGPGWLEVDMGGVGRTLAIPDSATFWRGGECSPESFAAGDSVLVRAFGSQVQRAWANLDRVQGVLSSQDGSTLAVQPQASGPQTSTDTEVVLGTATVMQDAGTLNNVGVLPVLPQGTLVDAIGLRSTGYLQATMLSFLTPSAAAAADPASDPGPVVTYASAGPDSLQYCTYTYNGYASWFNCATGAGACGTCSTSRSDQCAWPHIGSSCSFSSSCKKQVSGECGLAVYVISPCQNKKITTYIADCGPNQNSLCSRTCSVCGKTGTSPVVDLTKPTFARFYDPASHGCFPASAEIIIVC